MVLLIISTQHICFVREIRKINFNYILLSRDLLWNCSNNINLYPRHNTWQVTSFKLKKLRYLNNFCIKIFLVMPIWSVSRNPSNEYPQHMFSAEKKKVRILLPTLYYLGLHSSVKRSFLHLSHIGKVNLTWLYQVDIHLLSKWPIFYPCPADYIYMHNTSCVNPEGGGGTGGLDPPPWTINKKIGLLCNTCPDPLKNHKATKPAFNVGPFSGTPAKRHLNGDLLVGRWWPAYSGIWILPPLIN